MQLNLEWVALEGGKFRTSLPDTSTVLIKPNGKKFHWRLTYANGRGQGGHSETLQEAQSVWVEFYKQWIFDRWMKGLHSSSRHLQRLGESFVIPLT